MTIRIIFKSGAEIAMRCEELTTKTYGGNLVGLEWTGCTENDPQFLSLEDIAGIFRVRSDEKPKAE